MEVFAVYMREASYIRNSAIFNDQELSCSLLAASTMAELTSSKMVLFWSYKSAIRRICDQGDTC